MEISRNRKGSEKAFANAKALMPGGVNSPVRAFGSVGGVPVFVKRAHGARFEDVDGHSYIDYIGAWGPAILGHAHPEVVEAVTNAAKDGLCFGAPHEGETQLAAAIQEALPSMEVMRLVSSGTEACMAALRVARGFTGRSKILKFTGCYHGHADALLVKAGSGVATLGLPDSPGVPAEAARHTLVAPFNDASAVQAIFDAHGADIAAVIVEPFVGNAGFIRPKPSFLPFLREITARAGSFLIFDEVMTGFRVAWGGVQSLVGIRPDLTCLGKVIGGGMPLAAYGGNADAMRRVAPDGPIYQAGTLSGNPVAVACGLKTLEVLARPGQAERLGATTRSLVDGLKQAALDAKVPFFADSEGGMFGFFFAKGPVTSYEEAKFSDAALFRRLFHAMLDRGIYLAPSPFEAGFVSLAHTGKEVQETVAAFRQSLEYAASSATGA